MAAHPITVLSLEQALALPYATLRMVQQGWRVIRIESTPRPIDGGRSGDPNRYAGVDTADEGRWSYFVHSNVGKEAIALNLKEADGQALLLDLIRELRVDVFCCNVLPKRYDQFGIGAERLRAASDRLVWIGLSAYGPNKPDRPGYDNALQAGLGFVDLTGDPAGPPQTVGVPVVDLRSGDEVFTQAVLALWERERTGRGARIDVSMAQAASSWLLTKTALSDLGHDPASVTRTGNAHLVFVPTDAYRCRDGYVSIAIGSDGQWRALTEQPGFTTLADPAWATMAGRIADRERIGAAVAAVCAEHDAAIVVAAAQAAGVPAAPVCTVEQVKREPFFEASHLTTTHPDGHPLCLAPPAHDTGFLTDSNRALAYAPRYGEHTDAVLTEAGLPADHIATLRARGVIA